jgi:hypothetical protein
LPRPHHIPQVLLLIDTASSLGREIVERIGRYVLENGPWSIQCELDFMSPSDGWCNGKVTASVPVLDKIPWMNDGQRGNFS